MVEEEEEIMEELEEEEMSTTTTIFLPQEIVMEILSRLPANSLVSSFKFVCKAWRTLIKDPDFVKMHLLNRRGTINGDGEGIYSNNNHSLICKSGKKLFQLYPPFNFEGGLLPPTESPKKLDFHFDFELSALWISRLVGSCNGLLCFKSVNNDDQRILLLNPSTRKYKISPKQPIECPNQFKCHRPVVYGFGCCCHNFTTTTTMDDDEYKVVRIAGFYPSDDTADQFFENPPFQFQIDIYSLSSNSWRRRRRRAVDNIPYLIYQHRPAMFVSGALHWMGCFINGYGYDREALISFDIRNEDFGQISLPIPRYDNNAHNNNITRNMVLMNLRGCLGIICVTLTDNMDVDLDIWVMKEYGIKESWTKECVIRSSNSDPPSRPLTGFATSLKATACFLKGDQILINGGYRRLALYDMKKEKTDKNFKMVGVPNEPSVDIVDYIETLVSLKSSVLPLRNNRKRKNCRSE